MNDASQDKQQRILNCISSIPAGKVASYGDIAKAAGLPGYARYVGAVLRSLPHDSSVPWHRIINSQGKISFPVFSDAFNKQVNQLQAEGVVVIAGKINLKTYSAFN